MYMQTGCFHDSGRAAWRACRAVRLTRFERMAALVVVLGVATALTLMCRGLIVASAATSPPRVKPLVATAGRPPVAAHAPRVVAHLSAPVRGERLTPSPSYQVVAGDVAPLGEAADVNEARALAASARARQGDDENGDAAEVAPLATVDAQPSGGIRRIVDENGGVTYTNL